MSTPLVSAVRIQNIASLTTISVLDAAQSDPIVDFHVDQRSINANPPQPSVVKPK